MLQQKRKPSTFDRKVIWIVETERTTGKGTQAVLTPRWDKDDVVRHRSSDRRREARRMFERFLDGKTTGLQPIDFGLIVKSGRTLFQGRPDHFEAALRQHCVSAGEEDKKLGGQWHRLEHRGTQGKFFKPANFPVLWVVPIPGSGVVVFDESTISSEVTWPKARQHEPWSNAIKAETCEETLAACRKLAAPFARALYGSLDAPAPAPVGSPNRFRRWWLVRRLFQ